MLNSKYVYISHYTYTSPLNTYLDSEDLFTEVLEVIESALCCDAVHQDEPLAILHVEIPHSSELFLQRGN
ncbi:hypothetical protein E2C01_028170 [Portunus trituberculatus]|uniref:Uncharacterized protein n=1 Tax=Portunus trituberculatus TaxID=210409 RepID=A0A5B7EJS9_PORTR|nr:hypothetical protein [Portunus trituberculatus]